MRNTKLVKRAQIFITISLYIGYLFILFVCVSEKTNYHMDEISTYILSNNTFSDSITIDPEINVTYTNPEEVWLRNMTVQEGMSFNYKNVWEKQKSDVHPPFYYFLIHSICSFMPGIFSKWVAGGVNIFFAICNLYLLRKLLYQLTGNPTAIFLGSCCYIFSAGCLSAITFFRMYIMLTFGFLLITCLFINGLKETKKQFWFQLGLISIFGTLTHYYFVLYLFFICFVFFCILLYQHKWKSLLYFVITMLISGISCIIIFPSILTHSIGGGYRGTETINNFKSFSFGTFGSRLKYCLEIVDSQLYGGLMLYFIGISIILLIVIALFRKNRNIPASSLNKWMILFLPTTFYFLLVSQIAVYMTDRYFHPIYPLIIVFVTSVLIKAFDTIISPRIAFVILSAFLAFATLKEFKDNWFYLYRHSNELLTHAASHSTSDCLFFVNNLVDCNAAFQEVKQYNSVTFVSGYAIDPEILKKLNVNTENGLVITIGQTCNEAAVLEAVNTIWPTLTNSQLMGRHSATCSYFFYE